MQSQTILDNRGNPVVFGYQGARPSWRKNEDALDRSQITISEEKVLPQGGRVELLSTLRDLERNNPIAKSIVQVFVSNLGSTQFVGTAASEAYNEKRESFSQNILKGWMSMDLDCQRSWHISSQICFWQVNVFCPIDKGRINPVDTIRERLAVHTHRCKKRE